MVYTDDWAAYSDLTRHHNVASHCKGEYVIGDVHA